MKTMTNYELIELLKTQPPHYKVVLSSDPEGNGYGSLEKQYVLGRADEDKVLILYPVAMHMYEEICPKDDAKIMAEIEAERK